MQDITDFYWKQHWLQQAIIVPTRKIIHPRLGVFGIRDVQDTPKSVCNRILEKISIQRHPICLTDADYDYTWYEIECPNKIEFESTISGNIDEE